MKDYYKTLGVSPNANVPEIKKAYRALAFKYHPDKNPDNALAEAHFKELQEAWSILSVPAKKTKYDEERWLSGIGSRTSYKEAVTPAWLLNTCQQLNKELLGMDTHRISHGALQSYILMILSDSHIAVLQLEGDKTTIIQVVNEIIKASLLLPLKYLSEINARLYVLTENDEEAKQVISDNLVYRNKQSRKEAMFPYVIILVTLVLCVFMYWYAGRR